MKRLAAALFCLLALAACAHHEAANDQLKDQSPQAQCARQVRADQRVKDIRMQQVSNAYLQVTLQPKLDRTIKTLTDQCLLTFGIGVPGGVEPVIRN